MPHPALARELKVAVVRLACASTGSYVDTAKNACRLSGPTMAGHLLFAGWQTEAWDLLGWCGVGR